MASTLTVTADLLVFESEGRCDRIRKDAVTACNCSSRNERFLLTVYVWGGTPIFVECESYDEAKRLAESVLPDQS